MMIAFRRWNTPPSDLDVIPIPEGDWDLLKLLMCKTWKVEQDFNDNGVWQLLWQGKTVLLGEYLYCLYDAARHGEPELSVHSRFGSLKPFRGELVIIDSEVT